MRVTDSRALLAAKANAGATSALSLPVTDAGGRRVGALVCLDRFLGQDDAVVGDLTAWRQAAMAFFLTQFTATPERTRSWLQSVALPAPDRVLFLLRDETGGFVGHLGLCHIRPTTVELDNVLRGRPTRPEGFMALAMRALFDWVFEDPAIDSIGLHVFSDNARAIALYRRMGFVETAQFPLRRHETADGLTYRIADGDTDGGEPVAFAYQQMRLQRPTPA